MRRPQEILDALLQAVANQTNNEPGVPFHINALDVIDLENIEEEVFISTGFEEEAAEEAVAGLQLGQLAQLGKMMGVEFISDHSTDSLWGNT